MNAYYKGQPIFGPRGPAGPDGNPIGTVISFMGITAPEDYLVCDGAEYSISLYPALASFFAEQFGASNYFGGDGTATFAVPDMRNLFLRGYHGEAEEALSGEIGKKQNATQLPFVSPAVASNGDSYTLIAPLVNEPGWYNPPDNYDTAKTTAIQLAYNVPYTFSVPSRPYAITSRPVNMAVLYCIKAVESTTGGNSAGEIYSTDETRIGTWIDGKPLYRKVYTGTTGASGEVKNIGVILNLDNLINLFGTLKTSSKNFVSLSFSQVGSYTTLGINAVTNMVYVLSNSQTHLNSPVTVIAEYTKTTDELVLSTET